MTDFGAGWSAKVRELQSLIDTGTPIVFAAAWDRLTREGWRWAANLMINSDVYNRKLIENYIKVHGPMNVAIGQKYDLDELKPVPVLSCVGLYVRDVEIQAQEFSNLLEDDEALARWVNNEKGN